MDGQKDGWMVGWLAPATPHCMICLLSFWNANHLRVGTEFDAFFWVWHRIALWKLYPKLMNKSVLNVRGTPYRKGWGPFQYHTFFILFPSTFRCVHLGLFQEPFGTGMVGKALSRRHCPAFAHAVPCTTNPPLCPSLVAPAGPHTCASRKFVEDLSHRKCFLP